MDKCIEQMEQDLAFAESSARTQPSYPKTTKGLLAHFGRPASEISGDEVRGHVELLRATEGSVSGLRAKLSGIVLFVHQDAGASDGRVVHHLAQGSRAERISAALLRGLLAWFDRRR